MFFLCVQRPPTEDELLARALAQSMAPSSAGGSYNAAAAYGVYSGPPSHAPSMARTTSEQDGQDMALQAALLESQSQRKVTPPPPATVLSPAAAEDDDWDEEDMQVDEGEGTEDWSDGEGHADAAPKPTKPAAPKPVKQPTPRKAELDCAYCGAHHQTEAAQLAHMASCAAMDD
jgi:hypothetical protein